MSVEEVEVAVEGGWAGGGAVEGGVAVILLRNRASSALSSTKLCISIWPAFKYSP